MARMKVKITDKRVLRQVNVYLKAGAMIKGVVVKSEEGAPQGSPLSPLLSNIVLRNRMRSWKKGGIALCAMRMTAKKPQK